MASGAKTAKTTKNPAIPAHMTQTRVWIETIMEAKIIKPAAPESFKFNPNTPPPPKRTIMIIITTVQFLWSEEDIPVTIASVPVYNACFSSSEYWTYLLPWPEVPAIFATRLHSQHAGMRPTSRSRDTHTHTHTFTNSRNHYSPTARTQLVAYPKLSRLLTLHSVSSNS